MRLHINIITFIAKCTCWKLSSSCLPASRADSHSLSLIRPCTDERCDRASNLYQASIPVDGISLNGILTHPVSNSIFIKITLKLTHTHTHRDTHTRTYRYRLCVYLYQRVFFYNKIYRGPTTSTWYSDINTRI